MSRLWTTLELMAQLGRTESSAQAGGRQKHITAEGAFFIYYYLL